MRMRLFLYALLLTSSLPAFAKDWQEGHNYFVIEPAQFQWMPSPGKVEVTEVFSYACPACNAFYPVAERLKASLPDGATMTYLPASFLPQEDWPMFQRAWCTAETLGIAAQTHEAMFGAVWTTGELSTMNPASHRIRNRLPTIEDAARFYSKITSVTVPEFVATADSFTVDSMTKHADNLVKAWQVSGTPTIVIDGKYRLTTASAGGADDLIKLVNYLVKKEMDDKSAASGN